MGSRIDRRVKCILTLRTLELERLAVFLSVAESIAQVHSCLFRGLYLVLVNGPPQVGTACELPEWCTPAHIELRVLNAVLDMYNSGHLDTSLTT